MLDLDRLAKLRFGMSEVPKIGGQPGTYEEKRGQWFLERSFFRDFVYRNPRGKKGQELADAVVLFDDVVLMVQIKARVRSPRSHVLGHGEIAGSIQAASENARESCERGHQETEK